MIIHTIISVMNIPKDCLNIYTTEYQARQINRIILQYAAPQSSITDATACIGGNSVFFMREFSKVTCVEKDHDIFNVLKGNIKMNGGDFTCKCYNTSYNDIKFIIKQDVIFIDPPWGGQNYKSKQNVKLFLDSVEINYIINDLYNFADIIALKAPNNFDMDSLDELFWSHCVHMITKNNKAIYNIIIFYKHT